MLTTYSMFVHLKWLNCQTMFTQTLQIYLDLYLTPCYKNRITTMDSTAT
jgi:hypothetical protein